MRCLCSVAFLIVFLARTAPGTTLDNATFVRQLYQDLLDRAPDPAGLNYWQNHTCIRILNGHSILGHFSAL